MALTSGTRLGVYEVTTQIGEGGMGQVYRATDTKLKRQVAIKILPPALATDTDRLARFQREAEVLASLNHPNIAAVHGLEESSGITALVMELVEGDDLSVLIARGAIPLDEALPIAKQIAEALEAAHEQGIIHRDLKPANIKVRADGTVKLLDLGLAKALDQGSGIGDQGSGYAANSPTITTPAMTMRGMILGTAAYMAPEQARGKTVDRRADIWAFGAVLFESSRKGNFDIYLKPANGSAPEQPLLEAPGQQWPVDFSRDGKFLLYYEQVNSGDLLALPLTGTDRQPITVAATPVAENLGAISPDSRWVAYQTTESGRSEVVVQGFPRAAGKWQVSTTGGAMPRWSADGKELYFVSGGTLMASAVRVAGDSFASAAPVRLFAFTSEGSPLRQRYAVSRDGRFLLFRPKESSERVPITIVLNWRPKPE